MDIEAIIEPMSMCVYRYDWMQYVIILKHIVNIDMIEAHGNRWGQLFRIRLYTPNKRVHKDATVSRIESPCPEGQVFIFKIKGSTQFYSNVQNK